MAFCSNCGAKLEDNAGFCANCGAAVQAQPQPAQPQPQAQAQSQPQPQYQQNQGQYQQQQQAQPQTDYAKMFGDFWNKIVSWFKKQLNTDDHSAMLDPRDVNDNKVFGIFAYLGLFCLIPMFAAPKNSRFSRYHANQGLLLLICNVIYAIISALLNLIKVPVYRYGFRVGSATPVAISVILAILSLPLIALAVLGIINVVKGKCKDLPFIGKFKFLKIK
ncbi:MAG: zinc ribbon domain-containing protein [Clostridia bacterium]|nr:zinc ribbon domain-containing protein [Clostridia bacterium]